MSDQATSAADISLAADFQTPSLPDWEKEVLKVLNRKRPEGKELSIEQAYQRLTSTTVDGLEIKPLYTKDDVDDDLGFPGVAPFVRGTTVRTGAMEAWHVAQMHDDPDAAETRRAVLADLERGGTAVYLRVDPDAVAVADIPTVLSDVLLDLAPVYLTSKTQQLEAAKALVEHFAASDKDKASISGNLGIDPIGAAALAGTDADLTVITEALDLVKDFPKVTPLVVDATVYHNAGAGDIHELAYAVAVGVEYVRALVDAGLSVDDAFGKILFRVSSTTDQFATIARLRALRGLWSRVGEVLGVTEEKRGAIQHAVTSLRQISRDDAYVNMLRATISTFAASAGGAEIQTVLPFDTAAGLPTDFSRRIARNTQVVLAEESNVGRVNDPAGGSWFVESLTDQLSEKAWAVFQGLDGEGFAAKLADGTVKAQLDELNAARAKALATRKVPLTGVSMFPNYTEKPVERKARPDAPELGGLQELRDSQVFEDLRDRSASARADGNPPKVLLACLGARRDFGGREGFTANLFQVGGIETVVAEGSTPEDFARQLGESGTTIAVLCSSAKVYADQGVAVAEALRAAGAEQVLVAGQIKELGEGGDAAVDGNVFDGMDVVELLTNTLNKLGA
ncbi:methylmalonyl-CoA mutase small subunit [Tessaracoccus flavus]|uniref:Methylmalonyl-CoA mutase small subunit n=1 Tax=Tessaracoccus flavus TaxID=1610493 RepID=A0A1Q2CHD9_9ACTN|nr:methylmalonyl-CoA mutase small subunit [Tessaracoccus flavus]AQP45538.1 methylmalonyl-CoA mutase small subunit [Tessaracoccus flavus]SDY79687.1 heterodimeric methylmalonyl-CoA mutase small subunit [Tessaracoccus flavus]